MLMYLSAVLTIDKHSHSSLIQSQQLKLSPILLTFISPRLANSQHTSRSTDLQTRELHLDSPKNIHLIDIQVHSAIETQMRCLPHHLMTPLLTCPHLHHLKIFMTTPHPCPLLQLRTTQSSSSFRKNSDV